MLIFSILFLFFMIVLLPVYSCVHISTPFDDEADDLMQEEFLRNRNIKDAE